MKIIPNQRKLNTLFYNNLLLIIAIFCVLCFLTVIYFQGGSKAERKFTNMQGGSLYGPIVVDNRPQVYKIQARFQGFNTSTYISGEVLDENKEPLYEFGKDLWHASGVTGGESWSEDVRDMTVHLTFKEKGTYYILFDAEEGSMRNINMTISLARGSYVAHYQVGTLMLLGVIFVFIIVNGTWVRMKLAALNEHLEEHS